MKTYYIGRFAIDVPAEFNLAVQRQTIRYAEITDFKWQGSGSHEQERNKLWAEKVSEIKRLPKPVDKNQVVIEENNLSGIADWAKIIQYYGNYLVTESKYFTALVDYGEVGVLLTIDGADNDMSIANLTNILQHYSHVLDIQPRESFYLNKGRILLPYLEQEESYARFEGPMGMILKVEMTEIHKAPEKEGIIYRTVAAMATGFATGLRIKKVRSKKRMIAGLPGEEEILVGDDGRRKDVSFDWEYLGRVESGEQPMIQITVDTEADNLDEKIRIWDQVLNSFRPAYHH